jgi:transposase InsO family protein
MCHAHNASLVTDLSSDNDSMEETSATNLNNNAGNGRPAETSHGGEPPHPAVNAEQRAEAATRTQKKISIDLMHRRLGHQSTQSLLTADEWHMWGDAQLRLDPDQFCYGCGIGAIRKTPSSDKPLADDATRPCQVLFMDVITNPFDKYATPKIHFSHYLIIVCAYSRYCTLIGLKGLKTESIIDAIKEHVINHGPSLGTTAHDIDRIHADAGTQFTSEAFRAFALDHGIALRLAAPEHQNQNGIAERRWQHVRLIAFKMLSHARLPNTYYDFALRYAWMISNVLPVKGVTSKEGDMVKPCTPFEKYYGKLPQVGKYRVFGSPLLVKVYKQESIDGEALHLRNIVQQGIQGIFVGFPTNQAGWQVYIPASGHLLTSCNVKFDEEFQSILQYDFSVFHDATPT